ncbi:MAG: peptidylprolyl isomerase [Myxococcota bacterium]
MTAAREDRAARILLGLGVGVGIALAAVGVVRSGETRDPRFPRAVAAVNGKPISAEAFARFAAAVAEERRSLEIDADTRRRLLERMIDEELLLQRATDLSLHRHEPTARRAIVAALIASVTADAERVEPDEETLRRFYARNPGRFARPERVRLDVARVGLEARPDELARRRAEQIASRLRAGEDFESVRRELSDPPLAPLPAGPLSVETLRKYLGPTVATTALRLVEGEVSDPARAGDGYYVIALRERVPGPVPSFEAVRAEVRVAALRQREEQALRDYLADLRAAAEIRVLDPELAP